MVEIVKQNRKVNVKLYNKVVKGLRKMIGYNAPINHVGSTAIPYMYGKNIIDVLIGVKDEMELEDITIKLKQLGFYPGNNSKGNIYRFFANTKEETKSGDIHLHLVIIDSDRYRDFLVLKNYLLSNTEERRNYSNFKKYLVENGHDMRENYKLIKSKYVSDLLNRARDWANKEKAS